MHASRRETSNVSTFEYDSNQDQCCQIKISYHERRALNENAAGFGRASVGVVRRVRVSAHLATLSPTGTSCSFSFENVNGRYEIRTLVVECVPVPHLDLSLSLSQRFAAREETRAIEIMEKAIKEGEGEENNRERKCVV